MSSHRKYEICYTSYSNFLVPLKYNIHDKKIVEDFYIKWNTLRITLTNGETIQIEGDDTSADMKYPDNNDGWWKNCKLVTDGDTDDEEEYDE